MTIGVLILLALVLYQAPELVARFRSSWQGGGPPTDAPGGRAGSVNRSPPTGLRDAEVDTIQTTVCSR